jgi:uncharacterized protein YdeI (YjbR/CyaY-like superfamily)
VASVSDGPDGKPMLFVVSTEDLRSWLAGEHRRPTGVWLVQGRPGSSVPRLPYEELIESLLSFGWIDASVRTLDAERSLLWVSPRRKGSVWSLPNKERVARLEAAGRLETAGREVIERAKADGSWTILDGAERLEVPDDLAAAFAEADPVARATFDAFPASVRKAYLTQIALARTAATRQRRIEDTVARSAANRRPG